MIPTMPAGSAAKDLVGRAVSRRTGRIGPTLPERPARSRTRRWQPVYADAVDPALQAVKDGKMSATVAQFPAKMAEMGVQTVMQVLLEGKRDFPKLGVE